MTRHEPVHVVAAPSSVHRTGDTLMRRSILTAFVTLAAVACQDATTTPRTGLVRAQASVNGEGDEASARAHLDLNVERAALLDVDASTAQAIESRGLRDALAPVLASDALVLVFRQNIIVGRDAALAYLASPAAIYDAHLHAALRADVSSDGTMGYTWGNAEALLPTAAGPAPAVGNYVAFWRRGADGAWTIAAWMITGGDPALQTTSVPAGFGTPTEKHRRYFPNTDVAAERQAIIHADAAFAAAALAGGAGPAFEAYAAPTAVAIANPMQFGPAALGEGHDYPAGDVLSWEPTNADVAASGDLGFTVGTAVYTSNGVPLGYSKYLTIWQKQDTGDWKYVADGGNSRPRP
jgi:ketosteroid isomerase-like protein